MKFFSRQFALCFTLIFLLTVQAFSEPLSLQADLTGEEILPLDKEGTGSRQYIYSYSYPQVNADDPSAEMINEFYRYKASDAVNFEVPMMADYYAGIGGEENIFVHITYEITCNNDDFFSVLIRTEGNDYLTYAGHTFSRNNIRPGSSVALPYLLGILDSDETDTWLQERQTARADELVRSLIWKELEEKRQELGIWNDYTEEYFSSVFYPEEDFYLDESGNPVFYLEPGSAADLSRGLLTFPIPLEDILDEM